VEVIDEGKKGFLGIFGSSDAVVEVREKDAVEVAEEKVKPAEDRDALETIEQTESNESIVHVDEVKAYLENIAKGLDVTDIEVNVVEEDRVVTFDLVGSKIAILIGKRGRTLN